jgi:hypothetical protein
VGTIVVHAGMPKAGSTSVLTWLAQNSRILRDTRDVRVVTVQNRVDPGDDRRRLHVAEYDSGNLNAGLFAAAYVGFKRDAAVLDRFFDQLGAFADHHPCCVVTSEFFAQFFSGAPENDAFLRKLDALARVHRVRVAYYFRPQHSCLEALWRQAGYRSDATPSRFVAKEADRMEYLRSSEVVARTAPAVSFEMRPFRADLLRDGSVVTDFVHHFLDADDLLNGAPDVRANVGLPLPLVNLLRSAPEEVIARDRHDRRAVADYAALVAGAPSDGDANSMRSRAVLTAYCHERFEAANLVLLERLGWPVTEFVPRPDTAWWSLEELDDLWGPQASADEQRVIHAALAAYRASATTSPPR